MGDPRRAEQPPQAVDELQSVICESKRVARFRRVLTALLVIAGAPVFALNQSTDPGIRRVLVGLVTVWLALLLPMMRVLFLEWHLERHADDLRSQVAPAAADDRLRSAPILT